MTGRGALRALTRAIVATGLVAVSSHARAAIDCSLSPTVTPNVIYTGDQMEVLGSVTLTCTRLSTDPSTQDYWLSLLPADTADRYLLRHGGGTTVPHRLYIAILRLSSPNHWATGIHRFTGTLNFGASLVSSVAVSYRAYFGAQSGKSPGTYNNFLTARAQLTSNGPIIATTDFLVTASMPSACFVGQVPSGNLAPGAIDPSALVLNYTSFSTTAQTANMSFTVNCTLDTPFDLSLSPGNGTLLGLNYSVNFSNGQTTFNGLSGTGMAQSFTVTGTVPAGQAGTCATAVCSATQPTTITISY